MTWAGPKPSDKCLHKTDAQKKAVLVKTEAEVGGTQPQAKEPEVAGRSLARDFRGSVSCKHFGLGLLVFRTVGE